MTKVRALIFESLPHVVQRTSYVPHFILTTILYVGYYYSHVTDGGN